ncbi:major facilitator superfamily domain-containing protein 10 isoform X2 [Petaurus breviceps papuanus]|uniref:major facilitator superfamily domain-containing protein 10 isoform X2 n=1 Tax=Petaurus breviceps papuanus TaxID=3040969 RepID=UPI0036D83D63
MGLSKEESCTRRPPIKGQPEPPELANRAITIVFLALLIDLLGFTLILPLLPSILDHYGNSNDPFYQSLQQGVDWFAAMIGVPPERKYNSVLFGGLIGSIFSILQFFFSPLTGAASDSFGRRPVMLLTLVGLIMSYALWALSKSFGAFLLSRVIGGISKGNVSLSTAVIADLSSPQARSKGMAMIGVAFSLGFTIGPMIGAYLAAETGKGDVFYFHAALLALVFAISDLVFVFCFLPETLPREKRVSSVLSGFQAASDLLSPVALFQFSAVTRGKDSPSREKLQNLKVLGLVYFLYLFLFSGLEYTLSFLTHQRFHFSSMQQGQMFFFIGITMAVIQGGYARRIKPGCEIQAVKRAILLLIPAFLLIGWAWNVMVLGVGLLLYSFGSAGQKGTIMGTLRSLGALARAVGPIVSATVYWLAGVQMCFTICSVMFLLPIIFLGGLKQQTKAE